jgi:hypothetical protein
MSEDRSLPRDPITNTIDLIETLNGFLYSMIFWLPYKLGLPIPPPILARSAKTGEA